MVKTPIPAFLAALAVAAAVLIIARSVTPLPLAFALIAALLSLAGLVLVALTTGSNTSGQTQPPPDTLSPRFGEALLGQLPAPLMVINDRGRLAYANDAAHDLDLALVPGQHFATFFRAPPFVDAVTQVLETGAAAKVQVSPPGQTRVLEAEIADLPGGGDFGPARHVIVLLQDRTAEVRATEMRRDFIANASHELRTPLTALSGYIETIRGHARDDAAARERFLGIMADQADRMQRLVDDLLSLSRIEMDAHIRPDTVVDVATVVDEAAATLAPAAAALGVEVAVSVGAHGRVRGDGDQLRQVVTNLIDNALKYGGGGPVRVMRHDTDGRIGITVADTGEGIATAAVPRLTERFFRVDAKRSRTIGGTGLGLAIVKHILNRHGGTLEVDSTLGEGSRFTFWLPRADPGQNIEKDSNYNNIS